MNIQSVDFARQIKKRQESHTRQSPVPVGNVSPGTRKPVQQSSDRKGRAYGVFFSIAILIFTSGLFAGLQLGQNRSFEQSLAKPKQSAEKKEKASSESLTSFSNTGETEPSLKGSYIIKVGTYSASEADELTGSVNELPYFARMSFAGCKNVNESSPDRQSAFRTRVEDSDEQNVFIGCFETIEEAKEALNALRKEALPNTGSARLFEIE